MTRPDERKNTVQFDYLDAGWAFEAPSRLEDVALLSERNIYALLGDQRFAFNLMGSPTTGEVCHDSGWG